MTNFNFDRGKLSLLDWLFQFWEKLKQHDAEIEDLQGPAGNPGEQGPPAWIDGPLIPLVLTPEDRKGLFFSEETFIFPENVEVVKDD